ncbi:MAG: TRAP transporter small permease [Spirochaeta sp.]|jgi:TRAP-type C4-dicarboxylate transport system permease small subunit|nr:TRAP transporter small permease [Spirochaeta sp.]
MLSALKSVERGIDAVVRRVAFVALAGMIVVITLQIIFRVFFDAISWSEEVARYLLVWTTFLGATLAWYRRRHIAVTFVVDGLPGPVRRIARTIAHLISIAFFGILIVVGIRYMSTQGFQVSASLRLPMPYVYSIIPATSAVMLLYAVTDLLELLFQEDE